MSVIELTFTKLLFARQVLRRTKLNFIEIRLAFSSWY